MKNLFKILTLLWLGVIVICMNISYAAAPVCDFSGDSTITSIINGTTSGKSCSAGNQLLALVGICPNNADATFTAMCAQQMPPLTGTALDQCKDFYKKAYYGKVQAACNYLANVAAADNSYAAPPPKPRS